MLCGTKADDDEAAAASPSGKQAPLSRAFFTSGSIGEAGPDVELAIDEATFGGDHPVICSAISRTDGCRILSGESAVHTAQADPKIQPWLLLQQPPDCRPPLAKEQPVDDSAHRGFEPPLGPAALHDRMTGPWVPGGAPRERVSERDAQCLVREQSLLACPPFAGGALAHQCPRRGSREYTADNL